MRRMSPSERLPALVLLVSSVLGSCADPVTTESLEEAEAPLALPSSSAALRAAWVRATQESAGPEYAWTLRGDGSLTATAASAVFTLSSGGLEVAERTRSAGSPLRLSTVGVGRGRDVEQLRTAAFDADGHSARMARGAVVERWVHGPLGVEHLLELRERPPGEGAVRVELAVEGLRASLHDDAVVFADERGVRARYGDLLVEDATGRALPSGFEVSERGAIIIELDDRGARYPIVVDPLVTAEHPMLLHSDSRPLAEFGSAIAVSRDGTRAIVGAPHAEVDGLLDVGAARVFVRTGPTSWSPEAPLTAPDFAHTDQFGASVAIDGDGTRVAIGVQRDETTPGGGTTGSIRVFRRSGTAWTQEAMLVAPTSPGSLFGHCVAMSADGSRIVAGAPQHDAGRGGAWVFVRSGTSWSLETSLGAVLSSEPGYGRSVAITDDASRAIVGAPFDDRSWPDAGSSHVFVRSGTTWTHEARLEHSLPAGADRGGWSVALSADGSRALVGVIQDSLPAGASEIGFAGTARVFRRDGTSWVQEATLRAFDARASDQLGVAVALSADGSRAVVGAHLDDVGTVLNQGTARVYVRSGTTWTEEATLQAADGEQNDYLGSAVAITSDGALALVGARGDDVLGSTDRGSVRVFSLLAPQGASCADDAQCASGFCVDLVCCDTACGGGATDDCQACSAAAGAAADGTCGALSAAVAPTVICRAPAGACDAPEVCASGSTACPADAVALAGTVCRGAAGSCDLEEVCDGSTPACPADVLVAAGTQCRAAADLCDVAEACTGLSGACPADAFLAAGTECRAAVGGCDVAESCTGTGPACPADALVAAGSVCRPSAGSCDVAESCTGGSPACPADALVTAGTTCRAASGDCDVAESCTGTGPACPADALLPAGTECRAVAGACDRAETCTGLSPACPLDGFFAAGAVCRPAVGDCDAVETCSGLGPTCPADALAPAGTECRPAAGDCDVAETCSGAATSCPSDGFRSAGFACRPAAGDCDLAEVCTGASAGCPSDSLASAGTVCRAAAGDCDVTEACTGSDVECPADGFASAGTACRDASCTGGVATTAASCSGDASSCPPGVTTTCAPFACAAETCLASCSSDAQCAAGHYCDDAGTCRARDPLGTVCADDGDCASGFCVDGVCCESACDGQCEACGEAGSLGACVAVTGAPRGARAACAAEATECGGACGGVERETCAYPGAEVACGAESCAGGIATSAASCDGAGGCSAGGETPCAPFACGATACLTTCEDDDDCASGFGCEAGACVDDVVLDGGDIGPVDAGPDAGVPPPVDGGCGCRASAGGERWGGGILALQLAALWMRRRRA